MCAVSDLERKWAWVMLVVEDHYASTLAPLSLEYGAWRGGLLAASTQSRDR